MWGRFVQTMRIIFISRGISEKMWNKRKPTIPVTFRETVFWAAVADGMGGEDSGELASLLAVRALEPCSFEQMGKTAQISITRANSHICNQIKKNGSRRMGSTLTALYIDDGRALCCNIGDSRCYLLRDEMLTLLSTDHNRAKTDGRAWGAHPRASRPASKPS